MKATLEWVQINGAPVALQWGSPVPDFELQDHPTINLGGYWKKERLTLNHDLSFAARNGETLQAIEAEGDGRHLPGYDDSAWLGKKLPMVESYMPGDESNPPEPFHGGVWYRRSVFVPETWQGNINRLISLGANYIFDLWINGQYVGVHEGGYTPFAFDVSAYLDYGAENFIAVRIDKPFPGIRQDAVPAWIAMDWWDYTGIIQDLYLESAPPLQVVRADIIPRDYNGTLDVKVVVENKTAAAQSVTVSLQPYHVDPTAPGYLNDPHPAAIIGKPAYLEGEDAATVQVPAGGLGVAKFSVRIVAPLRWTPKGPFLYVMETTARAGSFIDVHYNQFGVRTVTRENGQLRLNGRVAFLPGIARHEDWPDSGRSATWEKIRDDLQLIRELNVLFLRTGHYPNHPYTYVLADRLGLAVMEEIPVYWFFSWNWSRQDERRIADQMFREMALAGANRPSIILWSLSNECPFVFAYANTAYNQRIADDFHTHLDDGRMLTQSPAAQNWRLSLSTEEPLDVAGWTTYYGVFYGDDQYAETKEFILQHAQEKPELPIVSTEYGAWSEADDSNAQEQVDLFGGTWQAFTETAALDPQGNVRPNGRLAAVTWFCVFNWFTKNGLPEFIAPYLQSMGIIHMDRTTWKPAAEVLREAYRVYYEFGGLGPVPDDYVDEEEPVDDDTTDDDAADDDAADDDNDNDDQAAADDDDDSVGGCGW
ncbi:MAG: glycoside hydrolase family 2 [Myxococcales bacterium]|nr:glycoside hydrolase family 2 [Myxococcales bacterium]